jgi:NADH-ubiquinone oxidoreductase chain 5
MGVFKALLFLAAGAVIHAVADQQDVRRLGGLANYLPFTYSAFLIGSLSLMAVPFLTGFYSKDLIIELGYANYEVLGTAVYVLGTASAVLTAFYSMRLISLVFFTVPNAPKVDYLNVHEADIITVIPLLILSLFSIFFGYVARDIYVGLGTDFFGSALYQHPARSYLVDAEFTLPVLIRWLPALGTAFGAGLAVYLYHSAPEFTIGLTRTRLGYALYRFFNGKYYFDPVINHYITQAGLRLGLIASKVLDRGVVEVAGPYGLSVALTTASNRISTYDTGVITSYALYIVLGLISLLLLALGPVLLELTTDTAVHVVHLALIYIALVLVPTRTSP